MAKITETTPKVERTFTVELTEKELKLLYVLTGAASCPYISEKIDGSSITKAEIPSDDGYGLYCDIKRAIFGAS